MSIFCPISIAFVAAASKDLCSKKRREARRRQKIVNKTSLTIKKHFVRFNLHFTTNRGEEKNLCKNEKRHHHVWGSSEWQARAKRAFLWFYTLFIYGCADFSRAQKDAKIRPRCEVLISDQMCVGRRRHSLYSWREIGLKKIEKDSSRAELKRKNAQIKIQTKARASLKREKKSLADLHKCY